MCVCGGHRSYISWSCSYRRFDQHLVDVEHWNCSPGEGSLDPFLIVEPSLQTHLSFSQRSTSFYLSVGLCICVWVYTCEFRCPKSWEEDSRFWVCSYSQLWDTNMTTQSCTVSLCWTQVVRITSSRIGEDPGYEVRLQIRPTRRTTTTNCSSNTCTLKEVSEDELCTQGG